MKRNSREELDQDESDQLSELDDGSLGALFAVAEAPADSDLDDSQSIEAEETFEDEGDELLELSFNSVDESQEGLQTEEDEELENFDELEQEVEAMLTEEEHKHS